MMKALKSLFGYGPKDTNLPDERKGKRVPRLGGGATLGGKPDDARWADLNKRKSDQALGSLRKFGETVRKATKK